MSGLTTSLSNVLKIRLPVIQAPMAGVTTPALISEVIQSGGLGTLPLGYLNLDEAQNVIRQTKAITTGFATNIFIPTQNTIRDPALELKMIKHINAYRNKLQLSDISTIPFFQETNIEALIEVIINEGISILSFTFGTLSKKKINELHKKGLFIIGTATTVEEGLKLESLGCDAVIAQGYEAGGHRGGGFLNEQSIGGLTGSMVLIPSMVQALQIPVIAAGGIMNGAGIVAALALGAQAVQLGTAFLTCNESAASAMHKKMILTEHEDSTCVTKVFTGKPARGFQNRFVIETENKFYQNEILPYPEQHQLTKELRSKANQQDYSDYSSLWSGQGTRLSRKNTVADFMRQLEAEVDFTISKFTNL